MNYKHLFDHNPNPCWIFDKHTYQILVVNRAAIEKYGYSEPEFLKLKVTDLRPIEDVAHFLSHQAISVEEELHDDIWRHKDKFGRIFLVRILSQLTDYKGRKARFVTAIDIDRKVKLEQHNNELMHVISEQKKQLEDIFASIQEVIWGCDATDFTMCFVNGACQNVFGYTPEELIGKNGILIANLHEDDKARVQSAIKTIYEKGHFSFKFRTYTKNGILKHIQHRCTLIRNEKGEPKLITGISIDVTEQELAKEKAEKHENTISELIESITDAFFR